MDQAKTYAIDRSAFPPGPWDSEPEDLIDFVAAGFRCAIRRTCMGHWCGYVAVPDGHPAHGVSDIFGRVFQDLAVDGGITFGGSEAADIFADPGSWWLGWDAAHCWHISPMLGAGGPDAYYVTRDAALYETTAFAQQLAEMASDEAVAS